MMYINIPSRVRVDNISDIPSYEEIQGLLNKHGLGIARFNDTGVCFYDKTKCVKSQVPITAMYSVSKKEFLLFLEIVRRLDASERKVLNLVKQMHFVR